ncbi:hypothetical protein [Thioalkalivibrio sp. XN279]|uniref:hypothetical protein n=1 Tax=Thioalkalivibrio sp. XN279 TaxID=2714953 RepID=UPI00140E1628|nr:hypothetical protein [Thioalkalivibrio sp. XN279]NHA15237.1 hypothetical protein [Thioalkalivibrio sp. XN279]
MSKTLFALAIISLLGALPAARADVLIIEKLEAEKIEMPVRGATMQRVQQVFGAPQSVSGPVGEPPITRWNYDKFVVVFEHNRVIHSVARHDRPPRPAN